MTEIAQLIGALAALVTATVALVAFLPRLARQNQLRFDLETLQQLSPDSSARVALQQSIDERVVSTVEDRRRTRHVPGILAGLYLVIASPALIVTGFLMPWALPFWIVGFLIGLFSIAEATPRTERTKSGLQQRLARSTPPVEA